MVRGDDEGKDLFHAQAQPDQIGEAQAGEPARLQDAGAGGVNKLGLDTYVQEDRYYSYRRSCHRGEPGYGRQISLIGMAE